MKNKIEQVKYLLLGCCLLGIGNSVALAQDQQALSLQQAINLSLENSKELKVSDTKVKQAVASFDEAKNNRLPDINISGQYLRVNKPHISSKLGGDDSDDGGDNSEGGSDIPNVNQAMFGMATASLPIFAGGKINNGIASAKFLQKAAELDAVRDRQEVIQNTISAYYNLYKAQAAVKLVTENLESSKQRVKDFTNMEANGLVARNDLLKVQLQESNVELALLNAENNEKITNFNFNLMLGLPEETRIVLDTTGLQVNQETKNLAEWESLALENRADFKALSSRQEAAEAGVKVAKADYYPAFSASAGYIAINVPHALSVTNAVNAGVGISYNLAALYKSGAKVRQAKAQSEELSWNQEQLKDGIRIGIHQAYQDYIQSLKKIQVYTKAVEQANENYRITKNKYDNSLATTTDLLDADVARLQAGLDYEYAKADAVVAYNKLYESAGVDKEQ